MEKSRKTIIFPTLLLILCFGVYYGLFSWLAPYVGDDMRFIREYMLYNSGQTGFDTGAFWKFMSVLRAVDNSRLCNAVYMAVRSPGSHVVTGIAAGLTAMLFAWGVFLVNGRRLRPTVVFLCAVVMVFPWRENTIALINYMNTMLPSAVTLLFLYLLLSRRICGSTAALSGAALFAFAAGAMHEGYAAPVCAGMTALLLKNRGRIPARWWILGLCYAAGGLFVAFSPGIIMRTTERIVSGVSLKGAVSMSAPIWLGIVTFAAMAATRVGRRALAAYFRSDIATVATVAFAVSAAIVAYGGLENPRAWWIPCFFATIAAIGATTPFIYRLPRSIVVLALAATGIFSVNQLRVQAACSAVNEEIGRQMAATPTGTVYRDYEVLLPRVTLMQPVKNVWFDALHLLTVNFARPEGKIYCVVAESLAGITREQSEAINGRRNPGCGFIPVKGKRGWWYYGHEIVAPDTIVTKRHWTGELEQPVVMDRRFDVIAAPGTALRRDIPFMLQRFVTMNGDTLLWIHTDVRGLEPPFTEIR